MWITKHFRQLSLDELYAILQLRLEVFVVEQNCPFQDLDDKDQDAYHLMGWRQGKLLAYGRLLAPGIAFEEMSVGRVVTSPSARGMKLGRELMEVSIQKARELFSQQSIKIGAQLYLHKFYSSLGFVQTSEMYLEDGIPHVEMVLK
ncbi:MAG: GNAT family N-acetyltransferase [Chitinophagaceae bacterium]